jgi:hypothetical protein
MIPGIFQLLNYLKIRPNNLVKTEPMTTAAEAVKHIKSGDNVFIHSAAADRWP